MSVTNPLPCPFCGHIGVDVVDSNEHAWNKWKVAECPNCGARAGEVRRIHTDDDPDAEVRKRAIREWNTRFH